MKNINPGWHTTVEPFYFLSARLLSILAIFMLIGFIAIKILKVKKEKYHRPLNIINLIFCISVSLLLLSYFYEFFIAWYSGYLNEHIEFLNQSIDSLWLLYIAFGWLPLLFTQLFWRKKNRMNINLSLFIVFMFNIHLWFEKIYIIIVTFLRN